MKQQPKQTPDHAFEKALKENIQGSRHAIKFIPNRLGRIAKSFIELSQTKEKQRIEDVYSPTVVCLDYD